MCKKGFSSPFLQIHWPDNVSKLDSKRQLLEFEERFPSDLLTVSVPLSFLKRGMSTPTRCIQQRPDVIAVMHELFDMKIVKHCSRIQQQLFCRNNFNKIHAKINKYIFILFYLHEKKTKPIVSYNWREIRKTTMTL